MSSNKINSTINRVILKTLSSSLQNFQLINGISSIVDENAQISDLLLNDNASDTQTLLHGCKQIIDYAVARGLATITVVNKVVDASGNVTTPASVKFNYNQSYYTTPTRSSTLTLYELDLTYFYEFNGAINIDNQYSQKTNTDLYDGVDITNAEYVSEVNKVISSMEQCANLINDIMSGL